MHSNRFNKYIGAIALGTVIMAVPSCSDKLEGVLPGDNSVSTETLWEQISKNPNLTKFASIAQHAKYYKDDKHPVMDYSFENVLNSGQVNTVWAPDDAHFPDAEYNKWLNLCETDGYAVQQQFMGNHIALWRHNVAGTEIDSIKMINGKVLAFDRGKATLAGVPIDERNIGAANGTIHTLQGITPFHYNFYEHIKYSGTLPLLSEYVVGKDTTYFNSGASIEGLPDKNGNPTYVDSVYTKTNRLMVSKRYLPNTGAENWQMYEEGFGANINGEDSAFVMIMPTDQAWNTAYEKLKPYYKYAPQYEDKQKGDQGSATMIKYSDACFAHTTGADGKVVPLTAEEFTDSLRDMSIKMDMISPLVFNVNKQPKIGGSTGVLWTPEQFIASKGNEAKYFLNTYGDTIRNVYDADSNLVWNKTALFNGECIQMSNGYGYEATEWAFPREFYKPDVEVEIGYGVFYYTSNTSTYYKVGNGTRSQSFNNNAYSYISDRYGKVSNNNFYLLINPGATSNPHVEMKLVGNYNNTNGTYGENRQVMSGKYDIQIVTVPYWYKTISDAGEIDSVFYDSAYVDSISKLSQYKFKCQLRYNNGGSKDAQFPSSSKWQESSSAGNKVDTITVFENFEFPYTYKNMRFSYPTLILEGACTKDLNDPNKNKGKEKGEAFVWPLYVDRIILKSKETDDEIVVQP